jgi:hypothetical protein
VPRNIGWFWDRSLTWRLSVMLGGLVVALTALTFLLPERFGTPAGWIVLLGASIVLARTAENGVRTRAQEEGATKRRWSPGLSLSYPWWARVITFATAVIASAILARAASSSSLPWFLGFMVVGVLVEWLVVRFRSKRLRLN